MTINHLFPFSWAGQHGNANHCQMRCAHTACNALHSLEHVIPAWTTSHALNANVTDAGRCGTRACTRCGNNNTANSHRNHSWGSWGTWGQGDSSFHQRSRACNHPGCSAAQNNANFAQHNNTGVRAAHNENTTADWATYVYRTCTQGGIYTRNRSCSVCNRHMRTERNYSDALGHSMGSWGPGTSTRCTGITFTQSRTCSRAGCSTSETRSATGTAAHNWERRQQGFVGHGCAEVCTLCNAVNSATMGHNWSQTDMCGEFWCTAQWWDCSLCGTRQPMGACVSQ